MSAAVDGQRFFSDRFSRVDYVDAVDLGGTGAEIAAAMAADNRLLIADGYAAELRHLAKRAAAGERCASGRQESLATVASAVTLPGPDLVIIGGGLSGAYDFIGPALKSDLVSRRSIQRRPHVRRESEHG